MSKSQPTALGQVYAKALLELAAAQGQTDAVAAETAALLALVDADAQLGALLANPKFGKAEQSALVLRVFKGRVGDLTLRFLQVVAAKGRLAQLGEILASVQSAIAHLRGEIDVTATVPAALDAAATDKLRAEIAAALGKSVVLATKVDPSILGGITLRIGDQLIDASVATRLKKMNARLADAGRAYAKVATKAA